MENRIFDYWAATLQDGYIGRLIELVDMAGGARALFEMPKDEMEQKLKISGKLARYMDDMKKDPDLIAQDYRKMKDKNIRYIDHKDDDYPVRLRNIPGRPYGLFVIGSLPEELTPAVAIIGSRECSEYGRLMAEYFGDRLARNGVQIISGMAWGIDGLAQTAALNAGGRTFSVMGCGVDIIYPAKNRVLYQRSSENGSGIISEYAPGTAAQPRRFPPRNRLISGMCDVLIVVEARAKSGTRITVDMAIDQGRTVMVVPGRLTDNLSAGCLDLLYQGAYPATGIDSVLDQLGIGKHKKCKGPAETVMVKPGNNVPEELSRVYDALSVEPKSAGEIAGVLGMEMSTTQIMLTKLEIEGFAREISPGLFVREFELA